MLKDGASMHITEPIGSLDPFLSSKSRAWREKVACIEDKGIGCESGTARQAVYGTNQIIWDEGFLGLLGLALLPLAA